MDNVLSVGDYEIGYSSVQRETGFHPHVSIRLQRMYEEERRASYTFYVGYDSVEAALDEARRIAAFVKTNPQAFGWP